MCDANIALIDLRGAFGEDMQEDHEALEREASAGGRMSFGMDDFLAQRRRQLVARGASRGGVSCPIDREHVGFPTCLCPLRLRKHHADGPKR